MAYCLDKNAGKYVLNFQIKLEDFAYFHFYIANFPAYVNQLV